MPEKYHVYDVGSTYSKLSVFNLSGQTLTLAGRSEHLTTLEDITQGLAQTRAALGQSWSLAPEDPLVLASSSAAGGLRMVAMGYMPTVTAKAAKEVAMNAGARVLEVVSHDEPPEYRLEILREIRPDIILLAGGTDGGDRDSMAENAAIIVKAGLKAIIIVAGNVAAQPRIAEIFEEAGLSCVRVGNVMPTIHELRVGPARAAIHQQFIRQITCAPGLAELASLAGGGEVIPTPSAILMGAELAALGTHRQDGLGGILVLDIGGATTDVHSVIPMLKELRPEERGLVINNDKQVAFRTVEGYLGLRVSACGIVETVGAQGVFDWRDQLCGTKTMEPAEPAEKKRLTDYAAALEKNTGHIPNGDWEIEIEAALAAAALDAALKRHCGYWITQYNPVLGLAPGAPVGRDLRPIKLVIGVGGFFSHRPPEAGLELLSQVFKNRGYSLYPEDPQFCLDYDYLLYAAGLLGALHPEPVLSFLKNYLTGVKL
ncbi:MAG: glutamate mutase L [Deltaproteobacteria bacterium]|jgi:uncharacterized protein (TIGR01319 family)|nr:glutamate mutase L [Deltaproteobacteria bacterium]